MEKIKVRYNQNEVAALQQLMKVHQLNTVCSAASCPNMGECYGKKTATFMILGSNCTRNCRFCNVTSGVPQQVDRQEPSRLAEAVEQMGLRHVVVTSVTRDDLEDGGASQFARVIHAIGERNPQTTIEVLIPDLKGSREALRIIVDAKPDVINHNLETVPELYEEVRPQAQYDRSLKMLETVKNMDHTILTKTGIMVGLGETRPQVERLMVDAIEVGCDIMTIGQYMQPTAKHLNVKEMISKEIFDHYKARAEELGFRYVASGPLVRSSYRAEEALAYEK